MVIIANPPLHSIGEASFSSGHQVADDDDIVKINGLTPTLFCLILKNLCFFPYFFSTLGTCSGVYPAKMTVWSLCHFNLFYLGTCKYLCKWFMTETFIKNYPRMKNFRVVEGLTWTWLAFLLQCLPCLCSLQNFGSHFTYVYFLIQLKIL